MSLAREYVRIHIRMVYRLYQFVIFRVDKQLFAALFNLQSLLIASGARCAWDGTSFVVTDKALPSVAYRIRARIQCSGSYKFGFKARARDLGECYFLDSVGFEQGDTFVDCGANVGDLKLWFDLKGLKVDYIGFEPSPVEFECLRANVSPSEVYNVGLWSEKGEQELFVSSQEADSSLIEPSSYDEVVVQKVDILSNYISKRVKCLKLEAEGAEPEILQGLGDKLGLVDYITADLSHERGVSNESTVVPVTNYLIANGFELVEMSHGARICALFRNSGKPVGGSAP